MPEFCIMCTVFQDQHCILKRLGVLFGARALFGPGFDVEREGDLTHERERPNPDADRERDVRCTGRDGLQAAEVEGGRAGWLAARGCDTDVDGVFDRYDGGGLRRLAFGNARRLWPG